MANQYAHKTPIYIVFAFLSALIFAVPDVVAAEKDQYVKKQTKALRAKVFEKLSKAQEYQEAGDFSQALEILDGLKKRSGKSKLKPHELAQLYNFYAYVYLAQEKYSRAIENFEQVLEQPELFIGLAAATKYALAQLYFATEKTNKGVATLEQWFAITDQPNSAAYVLLAQGYLQQGKIDKALSPLLKAFDIAKVKGKEAKENWYSLLQYIYAEKKQYKKQVKVLEVLVNKWPKRSYWLSLVSVYSQLDLDKKRLSALEAAYAQDMLDTESYLVSLAQMYASFDVPFKAAKVMEKGLQEKIIEPTAKNLERTGDYWRRAQETTKALPHLEAAVKLAEDGQPAARLTYVYMNNYQYTKAVNSARLALKKGQLKRAMEIEFLLGQALFHSGEYQAAKKVFDKVLVASANNKKTERLHKIASQWLSYMAVEIQRRKEITMYLKQA